MKKIATFIVLTLVILTCAISFMGCGSLFQDNADDSGTPSEGTSSGDSQGIKPESGTSGNSQPTKPDKEKTEGTVGDIIKTNDWDLSLVYVKEYSEITGEYSPAIPSDGKKFLVFFMECKNNQKTRDAMFSSNFDAYVDGIMATKPNLILNNPDNWEQGSGAHTDKRIRIALIYEVPLEWQKAELVYKNNMFLSTVTAKFSLTHEDVADKNYSQTSSFGKYVFDEQNVTSLGTVVETRFWKFKLFEAKSYSELEYSSPDEGKKYAVFFFEAENKSDDSKKLSMFDFYFYQGGYSSDQTLYLFDIDGYNDLSGDIISGAKILGFLVIEYDEQCENIEIIFDDGVDSNAYFAVTTEMLNNETAGE